MLKMDMVTDYEVSEDHHEIYIPISGHLDYKIQTIVVGLFNGNDRLYAGGMIFDYQEMRIDEELGQLILTVKERQR